MKCIAQRVIYFALFTIFLVATIYTGFRFYQNILIFTCVFISLAVVAHALVKNVLVFPWGVVGGVWGVRIIIVFAGVGVGVRSLFLVFSHMF